MASEFEIREFDARTASDLEFTALNAFGNEIKAEGWPGEPLTTAEQMARSERSVPSFAVRRLWPVRQRDRSAIVGLATIEYANLERNRHVAEFFVEVLPPLRRRGIGRQLLGKVAGAAAAAGRRTLITRVSSLVPAGEAFANQVGAAMGLVLAANQLDLAAFNRDAVRAWLDRAPALRSHYELGFWDGPYPEEDIEAITKMHEVMNTMPRGGLDIEDDVWTAEHFRERERTLRARKAERWTMYVRELATGNLAGYTEVFWDPAQPRRLDQGDTGVFPAYRNRGLGTWLKASMLEKVMRERPQVERVRTWNATTNQPMLRINEQLGFRPVVHASTWQVSLASVTAYLAAAGLRARDA